MTLISAYLQEVNMNRPLVIHLKLLIILLSTVFSAACQEARIAGPPPSIAIQNQQAATPAKPTTQPIIAARLGRIQIEPFSPGDIKTRYLYPYARSTEAAFDSNLRTFLKNSGTFQSSSDDTINVRVRLISWRDLEEGSFAAVRMEFHVSYEYLAPGGDKILGLDILSEGTDNSFVGTTRVNNSIMNAIEANITRMNAELKAKLPATYQVYIKKQKAIHQQILANFKKENRYVRVTAPTAVVRKIPHSEAQQVAILPQADLLHITGALPTGWLQVSREDNPIGWVHSTLVRENMTSSNTLGSNVHARTGTTEMATAAMPAAKMAAAFDFGTYYALVVGNNDYQHLPKLNTALNDAQAMATLLKNTYAFNVRIIRNGTRAEILRAINSYRRTLTRSDNLLVYYAGHGWLDTEADQGYWLPIDAEKHDPTNWISNSSITDALRAIPAKHVLVIADSCYSGKLARGVHIQIRTKNYYENVLKKKARTVMASGGLEPVADEGGKGRHSVFATALMDALKNNQGVLDATVLFSQIRRPVMLNTDQTPEYSDIRKAGHDGGDFLFVRIQSP